MTAATEGNSSAHQVLTSADWHSGCFRHSPKTGAGGAGITKANSRIRCEFFIFSPMHSRLFLMHPNEPVAISLDAMNHLLKSLQTHPITGIPLIQGDQPRPSGAPDAAPARPYPGGAAFQKLRGSRPSGKRPRRPSAQANTRLPARSPCVAPLNVDRSVVQFGRVPRDNVEDGTHRWRGGAHVRRGGRWSCTCYLRLSLSSARPLFPNTGLRERLTALPLGRFPEGRHFGSWASLAPPGNDLGGLRRCPRLDC